MVLDRKRVVCALSGVRSYAVQCTDRTVVVKKELSRKAKLSIYRSIYVPTLTYGHELWSFGHSGGARSRAAAPSHRERSQLRWLGHLFRMPPGRLPREVFQACPTGRRPRGRPRTRWRDYVSRLAWERLGVPRKSWRKCLGIVAEPIQKTTEAVLKAPEAEPLDGEEYLDIMGIMRNQAGRYECKASNDVATPPDVKYVNVVVNYPPTIKKTQSSETQVGRMGTLQCDATAVPTPEFEWYRDEKSSLLSNTQGINIQILGTTTILVIANVTEEDYGNYTCVASNRLGNQNASVFLYRPGTGRDINGSACVSQSLWLLLACFACLFFKC
ncbi:hypothetical protein L3Q82_019072 [Scortum barcoo]|uniref:Uncharacterized protein n=1 Tax=Scortum barcoo TaxID=214431 RepID=A0ACB8VH32_9TELE|nr:hypothetical protein L3Q82_019072 [Scortum barcoo]